MKKYRKSDRRATRTTKHLIAASLLFEREADSLLSVSAASRLRSWAGALRSFSASVETVIRNTPRIPPQVRPSPTERPEVLQ